MNTDIDVRYIAPTVCRLLGVAPPDECEVEAIQEIVMSLSSKPRIALIVIDAVGESTFNTHREFAPYLSNTADSHYLTLQSVMPTITPVNFASMATGTLPITHSIREREENIFIDTLFDALRRGGRTSAVAARERSTLNLLLSSKADERAVAVNNKDSEIITCIEELLENDLFDFFWIQLLDMDDAQHTFGVQNPSAGKVLGKLDSNLCHLSDLLGELDYGIIICSDHGQHDNDDNSGGTHDGTSADDAKAVLMWQ
ncbi:alkaline phosphatase family protein [Planctomycetota bacterium]